MSDGITEARKGMGKDKKTKALFQTYRFCNNSERSSGDDRQVRKSAF